MRLLLATYFFPPAGGGGVHRPRKFAAYLPELGFETHVLAPLDPKWIHADTELDVPPEARVHRVRYLGPRSRLRGEEIYDSRGVERVRRELSLLVPRLLLPDQHAAFLLTAVPAAVRIIGRQDIDVVLTTSPPSSVHLVGAIAKRLTGVRWVADLRDPIVGHPHRRIELAAVRAKERAEHAVAALVGRYADAVVAASDGVAKQARRFARAEVVTITSGCDFDAFDGLEYRPSDRFRITHTGMMFGKRDPRPFLTAVAESGLDVIARFAGGFRSADREWADGVSLGDRLVVEPCLPHRQALEFQRDSEALLLLIPRANGRGRGVLSAKVFEYLAARRPILAAVPPDGEAAALVRETGAGVVVPPEDVRGLSQALNELVASWREGTLTDTDLAPDLRERLSSRARVAELAGLLRSLV